MLLNSFKILKDRQKRFGWQTRRRSQKEKISVIVTVYNQSQYIHQCVESIRMQTYTNIEIIIIDDASTDASLKLCEDISKKDNRIAIYEHEKHMGIAAARNTGISASTGEFLVFVNGDDMIDKNMLEVLKKAGEINRADIAVCDFSYIYDSDIRRKSKYANGDTESISGKEFDMCYFLYADMNVENISCLNKLFTKSLFENISFTENSDYSEEYTIFKLINRSERIAYVHQALYISRMTTKDIGETAFSNEKYEILSAYMERLKFYEEEKEFDMMFYTFKRCMYRLYVYRNKAKAAECYDKKNTNKYIKIMKGYYKKNKNSMDIKARDKHLFRLFFVAFPLYCRIKDWQV